MCILEGSSHNLFWEEFVRARIVQSRQKKAAAVAATGRLTQEFMEDTTYGVCHEVCSVVLFGVAETLSYEYVHACAQHIHTARSEIQF
jgi:hypothetical protein